MPDVTLRADGHVDPATSRIVRAPTLLEVRDGVITSCRTSERTPADAVEAPPGTILSPGFVDPHVHLAFLPRDDHGETTRATLALSAMERREHILANAADLVAGGVFAARDCGDVDYAVADVDAGDWPAPLQVQASGPPVTTAQGHLHWCSTPDDLALDLDRQVDRRRQAGTQWVKIMASGGQMTPTSQPLAPQFETSTLRAVVAAARDLDLGTAAHALNLDAIRSSVAAGVTTIEHAIWRDASGTPDLRADVLDDAVRRGTALVWTFGGLARHELGLPGYDQLAVDPTVDASGAARDRYRRLLAVDAVLASGALVGVGSDAGVRGTPFADFADVLTATSRLTGLAPDRILAMASRDNAQILGLAPLRLAPGAPANVVALDVQDHGAVHEFTVARVWVAGTPVESASKVQL